MSATLVRHKPRTAGLLAAVLLVSGLAATALGPSAHAAVGSDDFRASQVYRGDFPDPSVIRVGATYYAFSTNTGGKLLPAMTSTDLRTWRARYSNTGKWWQNDALDAAPGWAKGTTRTGSGGSPPGPRPWLGSAAATSRRTSLRCG